MMECNLEDRVEEEAPSPCIEATSSEDAIHTTPCSTSSLPPTPVSSPSSSTRHSNELDVIYEDVFPSAHQKHSFLAEGSSPAHLRVPSPVEEVRISTPSRELSQNAAYDFALCPLFGNDEAHNDVVNDENCVVELEMDAVEDSATAEGECPITQVSDLNPFVTCSVPDCSKSFSSFPQYKQHRVRAHNLDPYECQVCNCTFKKYDMFIEHVDEKQHLIQCSNCKGAFARPNNLSSHYNQIHLLCECENCNATLVGKMALKTHLEECPASLIASMYLETFLNTSSQGEAEESDVAEIAEISSNISASPKKDLVNHVPLVRKTATPALPSTSTSSTVPGTPMEEADADKENTRESGQIVCLQSASISGINSNENSECAVAPFGTPVAGSIRLGNLPPGQELINNGAQHSVNFKHRLSHDIISQPQALTLDIAAITTSGTLKTNEWVGHNLELFQSKEMSSYSCKKCSLSFCSKEKKQKHCEKAHGALPPSKPCSCFVCGRIFTTFIGFVYHELKHHLNSTLQKQRESNQKKRKRCTFCNQKIKGFTNLLRHEVWHDKRTSWSNYVNRRTVELNIKKKRFTNIFPEIKAKVETSWLSSKKKAKLTVMQPSAKNLSIEENPKPAVKQSSARNLSIEENPKPAVKQSSARNLSIEENPKPAVKQSSARNLSIEENPKPTAKQSSARNLSTEDHGVDCVDLCADDYIDLCSEDEEMNHEERVMETSLPPKGVDYCLSYMGLANKPVPPWVTQILETLCLNSTNSQLTPEAHKKYLYHVDQISLLFRENLKSDVAPNYHPTEMTNVKSKSDEARKDVKVLLHRMSVPTTPNRSPSVPVADTSPLNIGSKEWFQPKVMISRLLPSQSEVGTPTSQVTKVDACIRLPVDLLSPTPAQIKTPSHKRLRSSNSFLPEEELEDCPTSDSGNQLLETRVNLKDCSPLSAQKQVPRPNERKQNQNIGNIPQPRVVLEQLSSHDSPLMRWSRYHLDGLPVPKWAWPLIKHVMAASHYNRLQKKHKMKQIQMLVKAQRKEQGYSYTVLSGPRVRLERYPTL